MAAHPAIPADFPMGPLQYISLAVIALAVIAVIRGLEVRLTLFAAALIIGALAGEAPAVFRTFLDTFSNEKFFLPIGSAMGFAYVIRHTGCDQHLVRLLVAPVRRMRSLVVPGVVLVAFVVNIPVISQTSTAVCVGPVALPLLRAAGMSPISAGATLCLGASIGGELLNPGAPELRTIAAKTGTPAVTLSRETIPPLLFPALAAATVTHWLLTRWLERRRRQESTNPQPDQPDGINIIKAAVPLVPLFLLFLTGPPIQAITIPQHWLTLDPEKYDARLIALAMLTGVLAAALTTPQKATDSLKQFFEGAGHGFAVIVSLIVTANCFGEAIRHSGLADELGQLIQSSPKMLIPLAAAAPLAFAFISGSGMASTQSLYGFFHEPAVVLQQDPDHVGAVVSLASAAGRTMSPVAAVVLMCASMTETRPFALVKRLAPPLLSGLLFAVALRMLHVI